jgi:hypothetical protein
MFLIDRTLEDKGTKEYTGTVFLNFQGAQESIPGNDSPAYVAETDRSPYF